MRRLRTALAMCALLGVAAAACASGSPDSEQLGSTPSTDNEPSTTTSSATTTTDVDPAIANAYAEAGSFPVGVTTVTLASGVKVEIWYPAVAGSTGNETYDARDFTDPAIKALLTADIPATVTYLATRDAAVADGSFPVVLNSHGFSGWRSVSSLLTSHLASWGMIVVSPDHATRDLYHLAGNLPTISASTVPAETVDTTDTSTTVSAEALANLQESVDDLLGSLDFITAQNTDPASAFNGHVDLSHVGAMGHSAGGGTIVKAAFDSRVDGYVSMASGVRGSGPELPAKPSFFLGGSLDTFATPSRTYDSFLAVPPPSLYWRIDGVGHNGFDDLCTLGGGAGIIGVADASGLGALLDSAPLIRKLGSDGCAPPAVPVLTTLPIIRHAIVAWFFNLFGVDAAPKGLGPEVSAAYVVPITIEQR